MDGGDRGGDSRDGEDGKRRGADETAPKPVNFNGVFNYVRFQASADPADKITNILVRN